MTTFKEIDDKYYQYCNVVMLPSDGKVQIGDLVLCLNDCNDSFNEKDNEYAKGNLYVLPKWFYDKSLFSNFKKQYIYITSSDEIKEGDWCEDNGSIYQIKDKNHLLTILNFGNSKKIIATTDKSLVVNISRPLGVTQELPQPHRQFIEKFIEAYNNNVGIDEVLVENEKATYEKWIKNGATPVFDTLKVNSDNTINVKLIKESYTRAELIKLLNEFGEHVCNELLGHRLSMIGELNKWAEENL